VGEINLAKVIAATLTHANQEQNDGQQQSKQ